MVKYLIVTSALLLGIDYSWAQNYGWSNNVDVPAYGRDDAVCFTLDEIVFFGSGNDGGFGESNFFYAFNTRNGTFQDVAPFPGTARQYSVVEEIGFKAYLIGGIDAALNPLADVWEYDLITNEWNQMADFPGDPRWKASSFVIGDKIYYGTGRDWTSSFNDFWEYTPNNDSWIELDNIPFLPRNETISFAVYERGYLGLGIDCTDVLQSDIWKYDPFKKEWTYETEFPGGARWYAIAENLNGYGFVGTGEDADGNMYNDFWKYDPSTGVWEAAENVPNPPRRGVAACTIPFKGIYFAGGLSNTFERLAIISRYTDRNFEAPPLSVFYQEDEKKIFIRDLPHIVNVTVINLQGKLMFESRKRTDNIMVNVNNWDMGVYIVRAGSQTAKVMIY